MDVRPADERDAALRAQMSSLLGLFALSMLMFDSDDAVRILDLAAATIPSLGPFRVDLGFVSTNGALAPAAIGMLAADPKLLAAVRALGGEDGPVAIPGRAWSWAFGLRSPRGRYGYVVASSDSVPAPESRFLLGVLAQQAGTAMSAAHLRLREREQAETLGILNSQLTATIADLAQRTRIHEVLTHVSAAGKGNQGLVDAVHELTGLPVVIEDSFGNRTASAGTSGDAASPPDQRPRRQLLARARLSGQPVRDGERLVALAQARGEVLGTIALVDPAEQARPEHVVALELGATVLTVELAHLRSLAEMQLRLRRDLVDDLLTGTDDASAIARSAAQGHDLQRDHSVVAIRWTGVPMDTLADAVGRVAEQLEMGALVARRPGMAVLVAAHGDRPRPRDDWEQLHRLLSRALRSGSGSIGIGSVVAPSETPRSLDEAVHALAIRSGSAARHGVTTFEELGIYRILASATNRDEVELLVREWLGDLLDYDAAHGTRLVPTLAAYYEASGHYDQTAAALHIHRSTLRYRLQRIRDVGGRDITDVAVRFNLQVAIGAWRVLDKGQPPSA
jgi:sugar diacid utilization regulator